MATVTGLTAERMEEIIDDTIVNGSVVDSNLILTKYDGSQIDLGSVGGISKESSFPTIPAPEDGDMIIRTDLPGDPLYKFTDGAWEQQPRMGAQTIPGASLRRSTNQAIGNSADTAVAWETEDYDTDTLHDTVTNTTRITAKTPGFYMFSAGVGLSTAPTAVSMYFRVNGSVVHGYGSGTSYLVTYQRIIRLNAGDYVEFLVNQNGGAGNIVPNTDRTYLTVAWLGGAGQTVDERGVPAVKATRTAAFSAGLVPNATMTAIPWDSEDYDTDSSHDLSTNTTRLVAKTSGVYRIYGQLNWPILAAGFRELAIRRNGSTIGIEDTPNTNNTQAQQVVTEAYLAAGDYVELFAWQSSGGAVTPFASASMFGMSLIASGKTVTPYALAYNSVDFTFTNADQDYTIPLNSELTDNDGIHDTVTNNSRLTCRTAGIYLIVGKINWTGNTGTRQAGIKKNGTQYLVLDQRGAAASGATVQHPTTIVELAVGDYVELYGRSSVAGVQASADSAPHLYRQNLSMVKIGSPDSGSGGLGPAQADVFTVATLPAANTFPNGRIVGVSDGAAGQQARMAMNGAWLNLG